MKMKRSMAAVIAAAMLLTGCSSESIDGLVGDVGGAADFDTARGDTAPAAVPETGSAGVYSTVPDGAAGDVSPDAFDDADVTAGYSEGMVEEGELPALDAAAAEAAGADVAAALPPEDIPEPIIKPDPEPIYEPDPQSGLLTGAEWNDNDNWDFWNGLYGSNNYGVDWSGYYEFWRTGARYRAAVTVADSSGAPVSGAQVEGLGYSAVTDNRGRAYLFFAEPQDGAAEFTVTYNGGAQTFNENVNGNCELSFTLDGEAERASKKLDLMIMCDTTGSMGDELEYLKMELEDVVTRIKQENANVPVRLSVNFYRDEGDDYVVLDFPFTTDIDAAVTTISEQSADGGGDTPEAVHTALDSALNSHEWDEDSVKVMFLVLDAPPHEDVQVIDQVVKCTREAAEMGVRIVPVAASGVDKSCEYLLRSMAFMTGGTYTFLTDDSGIGLSHEEPTVGSYEVEKLNDLMVRIAGEYLQ